MVWIIVRYTESLNRIAVTAYTERVQNVESVLHTKLVSTLPTLLDIVILTLRELAEILLKVVYFNVARVQVYDIVPRDPVGVLVPQMFGATERLGFMITGNIHDDSAVGFAYAHKPGSKILFTKNDLSKVTSIGEPTWLDYTHLATFGGRLANPTVRYYEDLGLAPLRWDGNATHHIIKRETETILSVPFTAINAGNDYFVLQVLSDRTHMVLLLWGLAEWGTYASGIYFDGVYSSISSMNKAWYVIRWQDSNGNGVPDFPTEFTIVSSGS